MQGTQPGRAHQVRGVRRERLGRLPRVAEDEVEAGVGRAELVVRPERDVDLERGGEQEDAVAHAAARQDVEVVGDLVPVGERPGPRLRVVGSGTGEQLLAQPRPLVDGEDCPGAHVGRWCSWRAASAIEPVSDG